MRGFLTAFLVFAFSASAATAAGDNDNARFTVTKHRIACLHGSTSIFTVNYHASVQPNDTLVLQLPRPEDNRQLEDSDHFEVFVNMSNGATTNIGRTHVDATLAFNGDGSKGRVITTESGSFPNDIRREFCTTNGSTDYHEGNFQHTFVCQFSGRRGEGKYGDILFTFSRKTVDGQTHDQVMNLDVMTRRIRPDHHSCPH